MSHLDAAHGRERRSNRTKTLTRALWYWGPLAVWLCAIFLFSGDGLSAAHTSGFVEPLIRLILPHASPEIVYGLHVAVRKCGHVAEYALLGLLAFRAARAGRQPDWRWRWALAALLVGAAYALVDELHQSFVGSRTGSLGDVVIDVVGCLCGLLVVAWHRLRRSRRREVVEVD